MSAQELLRKKREEAIDQITDAFSTDVIEMEEFERRLALAHKAEEEAALASAVSNLPARSMTPSTELAPVKRALPAVGDKKPQIVAVLGSVVRKGAWAVPSVVKVKSIFGSTELDFREAVLQPGVTEITLNATFGAIEIIVPPHLAVEVDGGAVFGSFEQLSRAPAHPDPRAPLLRIRGRAIFGSVEVTTKVNKR